MSLPIGSGVFVPWVSIVFTSCTKLHPMCQTTNKSCGWFCFVGETSLYKSNILPTGYWQVRYKAWCFLHWDHHPSIACACLSCSEQTLGKREDKSWTGHQFTQGWQKPFSDREPVISISSKHGSLLHESMALFKHHWAFFFIWKAKSGCTAWEQWWSNYYPVYIFLLL